MRGSLAVCAARDDDVLCEWGDADCLRLIRTQARQRATLCRAMLDIRLIREQPDFVKGRLATRGGDDAAKIDEVLRVDAERRKAETALQQLNADRKGLSKEIGGANALGVRAGGRIANGTPLGDRRPHTPLLSEQTGSRAEEAQKEAALQIPNLLARERAGRERMRAQIWWCEAGAKTGTLEGEVLDHVALGAKLKLFDLERAAKLSGSGFICFTGAGARLERALINFMLDLHTREHGYTEISPPFLVRRDCMIGTTQLPKFEADMYGLEENQLFLAPTAEVPVTNFHREEILRSLGVAEEIHRLHALLPPRSRVSRTRDARDHSGASVRQSGAGEDHDAGDFLCGTRIADGGCGTRSAIARIALSRDRTLHRRSWFRLGQDLRHRGVVAGAKCLSRSFELFELRRFPGAPDESSIQRRRREESVLPHLEWFRTGAAAIVRRADRTYQQPDGSIRIPEALQPYFGAPEIR